MRYPLFTSSFTACVALAGCLGPGDEPPRRDTTATATLNTVPPEPPTIARDVHLIDQGEFTRPAIPPLRTSLDGRVAIEMTRERDPDNGNAQSVAFSLFVPEALTSHWAATSAGVSVLPSAPTYVPVEQTYGHPWFSVDNSAFDHRTLCDGWPIDPGDPYDPNDPTDLFDPYYPAAPPTANPYPCPGEVTLDCYDLTVVSDFESRVPFPNGPKRHQLSGKPVRVKVAEPKLPTAHIVEVIADPVVLGTDPSNSNRDVRYGAWQDVDFMLEPMITRDGHLLVMRLGNTDLTWDNPETAAADPVVINAEIVYAVAPATGPRCDVTAWDQLQPISHAAHDLANAMPGRYGFARYPLRDAEGVEIPDGVDLGGSYPWIDRDGDNLFFTLLSSTYFYDDPGTVALTTAKRITDDLCIDDTVPGAAGSTCDDPVLATNITDTEEDKPFRGFAFAGLWSHGKTVLFDNITNNLDFGLGREDRDQRKLPLFRSASGTPVYWRVGTGRDNSGAAIPAGATQNSTFVDSWEQLFNHDPDVAPATVRDVVWIMNSGKASTEVAFDDYLDAEAIIVSEMAGAWSHAPPAGWPSAHQGTYHDGFTQTGPHAGTGYVGDPIRVQNAATTTAPVLPPGGPLATHPAAIAEAWVVPRFGVVDGGARIEPAALGGLTGKGMWLDGVDDRLRYDMDPQPTEPSAWFLGLFVDARYPNADRNPRPLLVFPDGGRLELIGLDTLRLTPAAGAAVSTTLAVPLLEGGWRHVGLAVSNAGRRVDVLIDGFPVTTLAAATRLVALLTPSVDGDLQVGGDGASGFKGWIDELKVFAYLPTAEVMCNHAHGTLVALVAGTGADHDALVAQAGAYPPVAHAWIASQVGVAAGPSFVCLHDYTVDNEAVPLRARIPLGDVSVRDAILLSGPLVHDQERPDSHTNGFCLSCHKSGQPPTLALEALELHPGQAMADDDRRQPTQPPQWVFGNIPPAYFDASGAGPTPPAQAPTSGENTDPYIYP